ncbi:BREX-2 system phosphatase PglZ [Saccharomonospora viridis]|mgnify:FL=1|uniref:BREX-2 system phosphatase PglZ n=1 Tax=Saccharomonospora viridis TaxID=1852 RepID=UPI0023F1BA4D|nr:BREX-2 system phosphatase PglZ [Saccharomonospora viridis]
MNTAPEVDRRMLEALVEHWLPQAKGRRLLLVHGRYVDGDREFGVTTKEHRCRVRVADQRSLLGVLEAWQDHQREYGADADTLLVVTTDVPDEQFGWDLLAYAVRGRVLSVDRVQIIAGRFGARDIDPRIRQEPWLIDALLDAEPAEGWPRTGSVLTRDRAIQALIRVRLGHAALGEDAMDIGTLLDFSLDTAATTRFAALPAAERDGLAEWLTHAVGDAAGLLLRLAAEGRAADAMPLGLVGTAAVGANASTAAALAFGGLLGGVRPEQLGAFTEAVEGALERWISQAESGSRHSDSAREKVLAVTRRAEELATQAGLTTYLADNRFLPSAFTARLHTVATALIAALDGSGELSAAEDALSAVRAHHLARLQSDRVRAVDMAMRLTRWLTLPVPEPTSVAEAIQRHNTEWAWVDRALTTLWAGDPAGDPVLGQAYQVVCRAVRERRTILDEAFAKHLVNWTKHASIDDPGGCLLIEQVLDRVAAPLVKQKVPLIVVLDGMSGAVAVELAEQLTERAWWEAAPEENRIAAVSAIPSVTRASRPSLLTGTLTTGDQTVEKDGFAAYWKRHSNGRHSGRLFHKADIGGDAGHRLSDQLLEAMADESVVVAVVLNTIDAALDHGREGDRTGWQPRDITYLPELLDAARNYGRPVILVSDHGHVLDRADGTPVPAEGVESARWRLGEPGTGELMLSGPRVLFGEGSVVVPWREDIRYTSRKAGYHGGAALSEMAVPVLVLVPSLDILPNEWKELTVDHVTPSWWQRRVEQPTPPAPVERKPKATRRAAKERPGEMPLFTVGGHDEPEGRAERLSLGQRVVAGDVYAGQRAFIPKAPDKKVVAAVIDALVDAGNRLPLHAVAEIAGRAGRRPEFFATILQRLLNVDGYPVLSVDGGRWVTLEVDTLRLQFGVTRD